MDCPKREAMNDSLIDPKMVLIATVNKSTKITGFSPRVVWAFPLGWKVECFNCSREIKIHVYRIRQTANVSGEFLRIETEQLKKVQNDSCGQNYHKTTYFCVEAINGKRKIRGKLGDVVQIHVCRLA